MGDVRFILIFGLLLLMNNKHNKKNKKEMLPLVLLSSALTLTPASTIADNTLRTGLLSTQDTKQLTIGWTNNKREGGETLRGYHKIFEDKTSTTNIGGQLNFNLGSTENSLAIYGAMGETQGAGVELKTISGKNTTTFTTANFNNTTYFGGQILRELNDTIIAGLGINSATGENPKTNAYASLDFRLTPADTISLSASRILSKKEDGFDAKISYLHLTEDLGFRILGNHTQMPSGNSTYIGAILAQNPTFLGRIEAEFWTKGGLSDGNSILPRDALSIKLVERSPTLNRGREGFVGEATYLDTPTSTLSQLELGYNFQLPNDIRIGTSLIANQEKDKLQDRTTQNLGGSLIFQKGPFFIEGRNIGDDNLIYSGINLNF